MAGAASRAVGRALRGSALVVVSRASPASTLGAQINTDSFFWQAIAIALCRVARIHSELLKRTIIRKLQYYSLSNYSVCAHYGGRSGHKMPPELSAWMAGDEGSRWLMPSVGSELKVQRVGDEPVGGHEVAVDKLRLRAGC